MTRLYLRAHRQGSRGSLFAQVAPNDGLTSLLGALGVRSPSKGFSQGPSKGWHDRTHAVDVPQLFSCEREIDLLREYRTRLVADVVTGELDVREAAARLPDEAPLDAVEDDADLVDETEAAAEAAAV